MTFISPKKLFSFSRYLKFCLDFFIMQQSNMTRKIWLISEFMTLQPGQQTIVIHILPNISRSKGNQTKKFGQLIEYNMRNIFLEKSYTECSGETIPKLFSEKSKLSISLDQQCKVLYSLFLLDAQVEGYRNTLNLISRPLAFISYKAFLENKKRSGTSFLSSFAA